MQNPFFILNFFYLCTSSSKVWNVLTENMETVVTLSKGGRNVNEIAFSTNTISGEYLVRDIKPPIYFTNLQISLTKYLFGFKYIQSLGIKWGKLIFYESFTPTSKWIWHRCRSDRPQKSCAYLLQFHKISFRVKNMLGLQIQLGRFEFLSDFTIKVVFTVRYTKTNNCPHFFLPITNNCPNFFFCQ